jgi:septal ring-binding cell division protein DamX
MSQARILLFLLGWMALTSPWATEEQDTTAQLGYELYRQGDRSGALALWRTPAEQGHPRAQFLLSTLLSDEQATELEREESALWLQSSAEAGFPPAQFMLGNRHHMGEGVEKSSQNAAQWWQRAAMQGYARAEYQMGLIHYLGRGVEEDRDRAIDWYRKAAASGLEKAFTVLRRLGVDPVFPSPEKEAAKKVTSETKPETTAKPDPVTATEPDLPATISLANSPHEERVVSSSYNSFSGIKYKIRNKEINSISKVKTNNLYRRLNGKSEDSADLLWLQEQSPDHHTIQIVVSDSRGQAKEFLQGLNLNHPVAIFPFTTGEKTLYGVVTGTYSTFHQAEAALDALPSDLQQYGPWIRRFGAIHRLLNYEAKKE